MINAPNVISSSATNNTSSRKTSKKETMSQTGRKEKVSLTLDEDVVERIDTMPGVKRSTLVNEVMNDWLEENGY